MQGSQQCLCDSHAAGPFTDFAIDAAELAVLPPAATRFQLSLRVLQVRNRASLCRAR